MTEILAKFQSMMLIQQARLLVVLVVGIGCGHACHQYGYLMYPNPGYFHQIGVFDGYSNAAFRLADSLP